MIAAFRQDRPAAALALFVLALVAGTVVHDWMVFP